MTFIGKAGAVISLICQLMFDFVSDKEQTTVEFRVRVAGVLAKFQGALKIVPRLDLGVSLSKR